MLYTIFCVLVWSSRNLNNSLGIKLNGVEIVLENVRNNRTKHNFSNKRSFKYVYIQYDTILTSIKAHFISIDISYNFNYQYPLKYFNKYYIV